jgi:hypothetical protein
MTHPHYRRQGIFQTLASRLYQVLGQKGNCLTYGFPNENSLPGLLSQLEWSHIATLDIHVRPLNLGPIVQAITHSPVLSSIASTGLTWLANPVRMTTSHIHLREVKRFDSRVDSLFAQHQTRHRLQVIRNEAYLNWRYADCPDWDYRIVLAEDKDQLLGYIVIRIASYFGLSGGMIMDVTAALGQRDILAALISDGIHYSRETGMDLVACLTKGDRETQSALKQQGFMIMPRLKGYKRWYFGGRTNNATINAAVLKDANSWRVSFGDVDIL